jgi:hypothetical protein
MQINPKALHKNWVSTPERKVNLMHQFRGEMTNSVGSITKAEYNANTGHAIWTATFVDGRVAPLTIDQVRGGVTFFELWRESEIKKGNPDPSKLAQTQDRFAQGHAVLPSSPECMAPRHDPVHGVHASSNA